MISTVGNSLATANWTNGVDLRMKKKDKKKELCVLGAGEGPKLGVWLVF